MRQLLVAAAFIVMTGVVQAQDAKTGEVKGLHICCGNCAKSVKGILSKVEGVADVKCDIPTKTVTFAAPDQKTAEAALKALFEGGFAGAGKYGDVAFGQTSKASSDKTNDVTVKGVHACCGQCNKALKGLFQGSTVTITGTGAQKDVQISGQDLVPNDVLSALNKAGFNGTIEPKK